MAWCQGYVEGCEADEGLCPLCREVMACSAHGHVDQATRPCPNEHKED